MDNWTRLNIFALVFLSASLVTVGIQTHAISAPGIGNTQEPGSASRACTYTFYIDGSTYLATKGDGSGNKYSGITFSTVLTNSLADGGAGKYCFRTGTFVTTTTVSLSSNTEIVGEGFATIIQLGNSANVPIFQNANPTASSADSGITLRNIQIDGNRAQQTSQDVLTFENVADFRMEGVYLHDGYSRLLTVSGRSSPSVIQRSGAILRGNIFEDTTNTAESMVKIQAMADVTIMGNLFRNGAGINLIAGDGNSRNIVVNSNSFNNAGSTVSQVFADGGVSTILRGLTIIGNTFNGTGHGIEIGNYAEDGAISANTITGCGLEGIRLLANTKGFTVNGNAVRLCQRYGIHIIGTGHTISGNAAWNNGQGGAGFAGLVLDAATRITVVGNSLFDDQGSPTQNYGIQFTGTVTSAIIVGNSLNGNSLAQVTGTCTTCVFNRNIGYVTENWGATSVADGGTITHGLASTPTLVTVTCSIASQICGVTALAATTFTVSIKTDAGAAGTTQTVYWYAVFIP